MKKKSLNIKKQWKHILVNKISHTQSYIINWCQKL